jgi:tetratricopeptide (TPR) repeat protein
VAQVRLFRNDPAVRWEYRVHEQVLLALRRAQHEVRWTEVEVRHWGYQESTLSAAKLERNVRLLRLQQAERPEDPVALYLLGLALGQQGLTTEAVPLLRRSLELMPPDYSTRPKLYAMLSRGLDLLGQREQALALCRKGKQEHPDEVDLLFMEALLLREGSDLAGAEACLRKLLSLPPRQQFGSWDVGLAGYKARFILGEVYEAQGRQEEAREQWRQVLQEHPGFSPARRKLGQT